MATPYRFQISQPIGDTLPRNRMTNVIHLEHVTGGLNDAALASMCQDIMALWQTRYGISNKEVQVKAYDVDAVPNYPRASTIVNAGQVWQPGVPQEIALCLSWAAANRGNKSERGRIFLNPSIAAGQSVYGLRPSAAQMTWALAFYVEPSASLPDLGGVDWKFGTYSPTYKRFTQSKQAWVNDDWDVQRRRGLRESTRQTAVRDG